MKYCLFELENRSIIDLIHDEGDQLEAYQQMRDEMTRNGYTILESNEQFFNVPTKLLISGGENLKNDLYSFSRKVRLVYNGGTMFSD